LTLQGRFRSLTEEDAERIQKWVDEDWDKYRKLASNTASDFAPYGKI
jgi:pyruvate/2-oxoacid:ferredoxin oxidoreductase beta subunit